MRVWSWLRMNTKRAFKTLQIESRRKLGVRGKRKSDRVQRMGRSERKGANTGIREKGR